MWWEDFCDPKAKAGGLTAQRGSVRETGVTVYLINVRFAHQKAAATKKKGLGPMARKHEERA